jgi:hypothetical protein
MKEATVERSVILRAHEVRGILDGGQTQFRRVVKPQPVMHRWDHSSMDPPFHDSMAFVGRDICANGFLAIGVEHLKESAAMLKCPFGSAGQKLWVKEMFLHEMSNHEIADTGEYESRWKPKGCKIEYVSDGAVERHLHPNRVGGSWMGKRPSVHMPRWASRLTLEVVSVKVQKLQDISRGDAMAEGCHFQNMAGGPDPVEWYRNLWSSIHGGESWARNEWVWVTSFKEVHP